MLIRQTNYFLQGETIIIDGYDEASSKDLKQQVWNLKKEVRDRFKFLYPDKHQSFYKLELLFLIQSSQNRKLVIFCNILRKKCHNCFCVLLWCKTFRYFTGVQSCSLLLAFPKDWTSEVLILAHPTHFLTVKFDGNKIEFKILLYWWRHDY